jgi:hypothetical protein
LKDLQKTSNGTKGGLFVGKSHDEGGIPAIVVDTGQPIEVEGGEVIINKHASKKYWKELSKINQSAGNGVAIPPPIEFSKEVSAFKKGGQITMSALKKGTEMEMEHSDTIKSFVKDGVAVKDVARKIAKDHLAENPNYYKILSKLKLAKGGEIICRSCGWDWNEQNAGTDKYICHDCNSDNSAYYKKGGLTANMSKKQIEEFYNTPEGKKLDTETYKEWKRLVNMSKVELQKFYNSEEGKKAGLSDTEANKLGIDNGRTSARWIIKMKDVPFVNWNTDMWVWAKKQISFIKRMSGNKGSLYDENGNKTRKHTSLLIWGHNPEKVKVTNVRFGGGGELSNQIEKIAKQVVLDLDETYSENEFLGKCKDISEEIASRLNEINIDAIPMRIIDGEDTKHNSPVFNHAYTFLPKTNQIIDTQLWQLDGKPTNLKSRKVLFNWDNYNNLVELYEVEPISDWENRFFVNPEKVKVEKLAKGKRLSENNQGGNCYEVAGNIAINERLPKAVKEFNLMEFQGTPYLIHAEVLGQGAISGIRYGHAWIEDDLFVYDFSNGREIILPKTIYYEMGDVKFTPPKYYKYTFKEAIDNMLKTGHYGSWDLKTQSGL